MAHVAPKKKLGRRNFHDATPRTSEPLETGFNHAIMKTVDKPNAFSANDNGKRMSQRSNVSSEVTCVLQPALTGHSVSPAPRVVTGRFFSSRTSKAGASANRATSSICSDNKTDSFCHDREVSQREWLGGGKRNIKGPVTSEYKHGGRRSVSPNVVVLNPITDPTVPYDAHHKRKSYSAHSNMKINFTTTSAGASTASPGGLSGDDISPLSARSVSPNGGTSPFGKRVFSILQKNGETRHLAMATPFVSTEGKKCNTPRVGKPQEASLIGILRPDTPRPIVTYRPKAPFATD